MARAVLLLSTRRLSLLSSSTGDTNPALAFGKPFQLGGQTGLAAVASSRLDTSEQTIARAFSNWEFLHRDQNQEEKPIDSDSDV